MGGNEGFSQGGFKPVESSQPDLPREEITQTGFLPTSSLPVGPQQNQRPDVKPPTDHPKYLLDTERWQIRLFESCWREHGTDLQDWGYGSISYAWGNWNDRNGRTATDSKNYPDGYPTFAIGDDSKGNRLGWMFPIVNKIVNHKHDPSTEQFTIHDVRKTLKSLGTRFVWWDWACIPQNIRDDGPEKHPLADVKQEEMNKMRFVYPYSTRTIMWMHNVDWDRASPLKTAVQTCADLLTREKFSDQLDRGESVGTVYKIIDALKDVHQAEDWFRSLWCFQEGVLCAHPGRKFHDHRGGIFCDSQGKFLETHSFRNVADLKDLIGVATDIVDLIIDMLQANVENPPAGDKPQPSGPPSEWQFKDWCSDPAFEQPARGIVNSLMATGLVGMVSYKPLSLLNARLGRYPSARNSDMEIEVNSAIGALDVDISEYLDAANATAKKEKDDLSPKLDASKREQDEIKIDAAIQPFVREGMLAELFKHYQWRMLLLATPRRALASKNLTPASQPGLWSELVKVPRHRPIITTPFTALENFMTTSLADRFHPPSFRYKDNPLYLEQVICGHYAGAGIALPKLEYLHDLKLLVMRHATPEACGAGEEKQQQQQEQEEDSHDATQKPFKLFDLKRYENPLWTKCMFYGHTTNNGSFVPTFQLVEWSRWEAVLGQDIVLVPLEYTGEGSGGEWQKRIRLRCVVLSNFAGGTGALSKDQKGGAKVENVGRALFVGVVDIEGEGRDDAVDIEAANMDLVGDVIIY